MNHKLEILKSIAEKGLLVVASSKIQDVSFKDYLLLLSDGFWVYNLHFSLDEVLEIVVDKSDIRIFID